MGALLSVALGVGSMVQLGQNSALSRQLGHYLPASVVSYSGGALVIALLSTYWRRLYASDTPPANEYRQGRERRRSGLRWWELSGGAIGCLTLVSSVAVAPHLSFTVVATVGSVGQLLASLTVDHLGLLGVPQRRITKRKALGAALVLVGCAGASMDLATSSAAAATGGRSISALRAVGLGLLYATSRAAQPLKSALNYRLALYMPPPAGPLGGGASFCVGMVTVLLLCGGLFARRPDVARGVLAAFRPPRSSALRWWMLVGGFYGATENLFT